MNAGATIGDELWQAGSRLRTNYEESVSGPWIPLLMAVGVISVICYRLQSRGPGRRSSSNAGGGDVSYSTDSGGSSWSLGDWFGSSASSDSSASSASSADPTGSWDSGGSDSGGDGGGGGGD